MQQAAAGANSSRALSLVRRRQRTLKPALCSSIRPGKVAVTFERHQINQNQLAVLLCDISNCSIQLAVFRLRLLLVFSITKLFSSYNLDFAAQG